jgi:hypothetical protein
VLFLRESIYDNMTRSEQEVAHFLKELGILWSYEKPIYVWDRNKRPRVWTPDFFLSQFSIYVEVCGSEDFDYEYRRKTYRENGYNGIFLHLYKESKRWKEHFFQYITKISNYRNERLERLQMKFL